MDDRKRKNKHVAAHHLQAIKEMEEERKEMKKRKSTRKPTNDGNREDSYCSDDEHAFNGCDDDEEEENYDENDDGEGNDSSFSGRKLCMGIVVVFIYLIVVFGLIILIYKTTEDLVKSLRNPVRSLKYYRVDKYKAPAIVVFPVGNNFIACSHYFHNIIGSKKALLGLRKSRHSSYIS
ncbi:DgyrCDS13696 [Dimorphilus gyrociliatus]|uniref:Proton-activated chloride channel n=1 Tax=Dimorphilus gyrociliatus TaxID=2664684 RepID=A0A7I8WBG0_9ANNE|nr:DgyrCDS13696 [Dimorphilus gyrociliatus]